MTMTAGHARVVRTMCHINCHPTFCGMLVEVEGGKVKTVSGDKENPDSQGFLCVRGRSTNEIFGNPTRLLYPKFVRIAARIPGPARVGTRRLVPTRTVTSAS